MMPDERRWPVAVLAPFANERVREWPASHFRRCAELLSTTHDVAVIGTSAQRARANLIVRGLPSTIRNICGVLSWTKVTALIREADMVVANNSGIAHLAASVGTWTLCVFSGSHPMNQWRPIGPRVVTIGTMPACAPCELGSQMCPHDVVCMTALRPENALEHFRAARQRFAA